MPPSFYRYIGVSYVFQKYGFILLVTHALQEIVMKTEEGKVSMLDNYSM